MCILQKPTTPRKACASFLLVGGDVAAILWHPLGFDSIHPAFLSPKTGTLPQNLTSLNGKTSFQKDLNYSLPFVKNFLCCVTPYNDVIDVLQMFWSFTLFQCSLDQPMANGGTVSTPGAVDSRCTRCPSRWKQTVACTLLPKGWRRMH